MNENVMTQQFKNPTDDELKQLLTESRQLAIVGLSPKANRPSFFVAKQMQDFGYNIIPVRPAIESVLGHKAYARLQDVPDKIDIVAVFRAADKVDEVVDGCIDSKAPVMWLQEGIVNEDAARRAQDAGITVVMDQCIYKVYKRLGLDA